MENQENNKEKNKENTKKYSVEEILNILKSDKKENIEIDSSILELVDYILKNNKNVEDTQEYIDSCYNGKAYMDGLSLDDIKAVHEYALKQVENYTKTPFNASNNEHNDYYEYFRQNALKEKEKEIKIRNFDESLQKKYGSMYANVEKAARDAFENMAFKDARDILSSRMHGNVEKLLEFYDNIFKELTVKKEENKIDNIIFPPKSINSGSCKNNESIKTYENFI